MDLTSSGARDDRLVLIFDGHCGVCSRFVSWAKKRDRGERIRFVACQDTRTRELGIDRSACEKEAIAIRRDGSIHRGADAINTSLRELPRPWPWVASLAQVWGVAPLERLGYRWFARNRHRFSRWGVQPECAKPGVKCE